MKYKLTYSREVGETIKFKSVVVWGRNLTTVLHDAERTGWSAKGWTFLGVESCSH